MRLGNKVFGTQEEKAKADREKIIQYKRVFGSDEGRKVLFDLMNRYHVLNTHNGDHIKEGQRSVVIDILGRCNVDMIQFDKMLKGEF
jgi:hypothetical protein